MLISDGDVPGVIAHRRSRRPASTSTWARAARRRACWRRGAALRRRPDPGPAAVPQRRRDGPRARKWGITDLNRKYSMLEMAKGDVMFAATGVTTGSMLKGVRRFAQRRGDAFDRHALQDRHGAVDFRPSQFLDQDWPAELGLIMMAGCGQSLIACVLCLFSPRPGGGGGGRAAAISPGRSAARSTCSTSSWPIVESAQSLPKDGVFALLPAAGRRRSSTR